MNKFIYTFWLVISTLTTPTAIGQSRTDIPVWQSIDASGLNPHPSRDERLGQPLWKATLMKPTKAPISGAATFIDNGYEENELILSDAFGKATGLPDRLWTIKPGSDGSSKLVIYSDGEVVDAQGSLHLGRYTLRYHRGGEARMVVLERIVN